MTSRAPRVLMVGTELDGRGGVAAVVAVLRQQGLFEREGIRYVATHRNGSRLDKARSALSGFRHVLACLRHRPVVHAHVASDASFVRKSLLLLMARLAGCRTIFHLHGGGFRHYALERSGPLMRRWIRHTLRRSSVVITLSEGWADVVQDLAPGTKVAVVANAVPLPALPAPDTDGTGQAGPERILFLGRLEAAKGVFELLEAGARLAPMYPGLRLVFGGEGDADALRRRAAELGIAGQVDLPGWVGPRERDVQLARAGVFCLPSHAEGLPMSLLEAMAAGKAVVASSVGGIPEIVRDGDNGLLVPAGDAAALAVALARVLDDSALRERLAGRARATIEQHYSTEVVCGQLSTLYRELARAG